MAEEPKQAEVDKIVQEGGQPLEDALRSALNSAEGRPDAPAAAPEDGAQPEGEQPADPEKPESPGSKEETGDEKPEGEDGAGERSGDKPKSRAAKKIEKLLEARNSARDEAAAAKQLAEDKDKRIKELEAELATRDEKPADGDGEEDPDGEGGDLEKEVDKILSKRETKNQTDQRKAQLDKQERDALTSKYTPTAEELEEVDEVLKKFPTLSDEAALKIVAPHHFVDGAVAARADAKKQSVSTTAKRDLRSDKTPAQMTTKELEAHLKAEVAAGRMTV